MLRSTASFALLLTFLTTGAGCAASTDSTWHAEAPRHESHEARQVRKGVEAAAGIADLAGAIANVQASAPETDDEPYPETPDVPVRYRPIPPHEAASEADHRVEKAAAPFPMGDAYGAVDRTDLGACKADGLASGYGHVTVTFQPDGGSRDVELELPAGSSPGATACVQRAYGAAHVAAFGGEPVKVRREFFVAK